MEKDVETMNLWQRFLRWKRNDAYLEQRNATTMLHNAWAYLFGIYWRTASANERGVLLPEHQEALRILHALARESLERQFELF